MKTIINPDTVVLKILGSPDFPDISKVDISQFAVPYCIEDRKLLYNTLTRECLLLNEEEYQAVADGEFHYNPDDSFSRYLAEHRFLSASERECSTYCSIISMMRTISRKNKISTYTILPTTFCNARCFYCYELNYHFKKMSSDTEEHVIQYIKDTHTDKEIKIRWFGGEPLLGKDTIDRITDQLHKSGILFHSEMITNGSLFTEELVKAASERWNLKKVQITLDGDEKEYNRRKNYFRSEPSPFKTVINNIHLLQTNGIKVTIRLNVDFDNTDTLKDLLNFLSGRFINKDGISVYCHPIFNEMNSDRCGEIFLECIELEKKCHEAGFHIHSFGKQGRLKQYYCIAADPSCVTIDPEGILYGCEHCGENRNYGSCTSGKLPSGNHTVSPDDLASECKTCPYLPGCTEFTGCPDAVHSCQKMREMQIIKQLSAFLR